MLTMTLSVVGDDAWCAEWHFERTKRANPRMAMLHVFSLLSRREMADGTDGKGNWHAGNWHLWFSQTSCMRPPIFIAPRPPPPPPPSPQSPKVLSVILILGVLVLCSGILHTPSYKSKIWALGCVTRLFTILIQFRVELINMFSHCSGKKISSAAVSAVVHVVNLVH